ncbi:MAG: hypothetical protein AAGG09_06545 [Pseudomonadota bacterium]
MSDLLSGLRDLNDFVRNGGADERPKLRDYLDRFPAQAEPAPIDSATADPAPIDNIVAFPGAAVRPVPRGQCATELQLLVDGIARLKDWR